MRNHDRSLGRRALPGVGLLVLLVTPVAAAWPTTPVDRLPSASRPDARALDEIPRFVLPAPDVEALLAEDAAREATRLEKDLRVGLPRKVAVSPGRFGAWEGADDADRLWRLRIGSPGAKWLVLGFTTFRLPEGAELYVYGRDGDPAQGPFGADRVRDHGQLWSTPVSGDEAVLELHWPASLAKETPNLHLGILSYGYRAWGGIGLEPDPPGGDPNEPTPDAGACNIDVNCPLGDAWQDEKRGEVLTLVGGSRVCSGSMIAAAGGEDCKNYMLTAHHCHGDPSDATSMSLMFNFERPGCETGTAPTDQVLGGGGVQRATWSTSDFTLIEMNDPPPPEFNPYWNGWSRDTTPGTESWAIHHPSNDEKKISYNEDPLIDGSNYGPDHWRVTEWEQGTTEGGSSGSPLFDQDSRIVGQLHGGTASCSSITWDEYGKLDVSWEGGGTASSRLKDWLDPGNTGELFIDGTNGPVCGAAAPSLRVFSTAIDDGRGNGNGVVDVDEPFFLILEAENAGSLAATAVEGTLTLLTPDVVLEDGQADWPDIPVDQVRVSTSPHLALRTTPAFVCGTPIDLEIQWVSAEKPEGWTRDLRLATGTPNVAVGFDDDIESGAGTWTTQSLSGGGPWTLSTAEAASPVTSWFVPDPDSVSDQVLVMEPIDPVAAGDRLHFAHRLDTEGGFDGGVLEYSTDGGGNWLDAGGLVVAGGYNSTISTSYSSPIAGRNAWSGDNGGFEPVEADLDSLAGQTVQFRWRFASDTSVPDVGWYVDDVRVENTTYSCQIVPVGEASAPGSSSFTIDKDPGGFLLNWSAPDGGATVDDYVLYRTPLASAAAPVCEAGLGGGTSTVLASLTDDRGFLVVARNGNGEGGYGSASDGAPRPSATGGDVCP